MPVGAIIAWPHGVTYPTGWVLCDGTANAAGSALDLRGRFLVGWQTGTHTANGGGMTHTHAAHTTTASHSHGLQRYPTTTGASSGFTADTSMSGTPTAVTLTTAAAGDASVGHDTPNSEPPYSPVDWIERMT